jgi:phage tail P2-like protein
MADRLAPDVIALDPRFGPLAEATARIEQLPLDGLLTYLIESVPAEWLPELGRQFHIMSLEGWQFAATDADRRRLIRESIKLHRKKGTPWAVKRALAISGIKAELAEWWQQAPAGAPFTFTVDIAAGQPAAREPAAFEAAQRHVDEWKPVSRHASYRIAAAALAAAAIAACGTAHMQWQGAGELLAQPLRGASAHAGAAAGHGFLLMAGHGTLQQGDI